jgi:hypothetical protein
MLRPGVLLGIGVLLVALGCDATSDRSIANDPEHPTATVTLMFDRRVPASTVAGLFDAREDVRLDRLQFHAGGLGGSHSARDTQATSAAAKIDTFRAQLRRRTRRSTRI